ncbi:hypothetical protein Hdeb2414_s0018g00516121 [Helianthus debilis subsp. tardiflorus]
MGISKLWDKPDRDLVLMRDVMSALDFIKSNDTSDVVFTDVAATKGEDAVVRGAKHRFEGSTYVNVPNVKGFVKVAASRLPHIAPLVVRRIWRFQLRGRKESYRWWSVKTIKR